MYTLQPYRPGAKQKNRCPACSKPKTYVRYIDNETGSPLPYEYGRCERINSCGYHRKPDKALIIASKTNNPEAGPQQFVDATLVNKTFKSYGANAFAQWLIGAFGEAAAMEAMRRYHIGTARKGGTLFWYKDIQGRYCNAKKIFYTPAGKRNRDIPPAYTHLSANGYRVCTFGEHLLPAAPDKIIAIVEAEKTAVIMSICRPEYTWLASGSCNGLTEEKIKIFNRKHTIILFPDADKAGREAFAKAAAKIRARGSKVEKVDVWPEVEDGGGLILNSLLNIDSFF